MKRGIVFGAGVSGQGSMLMLEEMGYEGILVDDKSALSSEDALKILDTVDIFIKSPGIPYTKLVQKANELGIEIIDDVELGYRYKIKNKIDGKIIAITGTNGKTTVTTKISELIEKAGFRAPVCGNIGFSFSETILKNKTADYFVLELSSYQLENLKDFKADIAIIINLAPDHLDRYIDEKDYYKTKFNIFKNQTEKDIKILNSNNKNILEIIKELKLENINFVGIERKNFLEIAYEKNNKIFYKSEEIIKKENISLKGKHNLENMIFVIAIAKQIEISNDIIKEFLEKTSNIEHRMEKFHEYGKIVFVNDSKGTNIDSTKFAVEAFTNPILICGGVDKKLDLTPLCKLIKNKVKEVYLIGELSSKLEEKLLEIGYEKIKIFKLNTLEKSVENLKERLKKDSEEIVLLSPATASFDQFKNFEERGRVFKELVKNAF